MNVGHEYKYKNVYIYIFIYIYTYVKIYSWLKYAGVCDGEYVHNDTIGSCDMFFFVVMN